MNLGVRAHDFSRLPLAELATQIASHGLTCIQLAPPKALAGIETDAGGISPEVAIGMREGFARRGISIAVLGCYINLGNPDAAQLRPDLERFQHYLRRARDFGGAVVGTETGSINPDFSWHPDNHGEAAFATVLANVRTLLREAEAAGAVVALEGVERYIISSPRRLRRLVDEAASPHLRIILDPVNLLSVKNHRAQDEITDEALALLGDRLSVVHAKDFTIAGDRLQEVPAGEGLYHYPRLLRWLKQHQPGIPVLLESTRPATITRTIAFMRETYRTV